MSYARRKPRSYELLGEHFDAVYGQARFNRLEELANEANYAHVQAEHHWRQQWQGFLNQARKAGIALMHAKRILGNRKKWSRWRAKNFSGSREKCNQYIRVAKFWDDPIIVEARETREIESVEGFLKLIRTCRRPNKPRQIPQDAPSSFLLHEVRMQFNEQTRKLTDDQLITLNANFDVCWEPLYAKLRSLEAEPRVASMDRYLGREPSLLPGPRTKLEKRETRRLAATQAGKEETATPAARMATGWLTKWR